MIPTSIDGTDITAATIDGTDVQEITVDGQTVFTAETLPVAYSNLVAWYPFESSFYGGSNADDVTALFNSGQSGDSTAFDGTISGATYQSSGGVTDINAGSNSGAFDFDGSNDSIDTNFDSGTFSDISLAAWVNADTLSPSFQTIAGQSTLSSIQQQYVINTRSGNIEAGWTAANDNATLNTPINTNEWYHIVNTFSSGDCEAYLDGSSFASTSITDSTITPLHDFVIGETSSSFDFYFNGTIDDVRIYDKELSSAEVLQIYQNTEP